MLGVAADGEPLGSARPPSGTSLSSHPRPCLLLESIPRSRPAWMPPRSTPPTPEVSSPLLCSLVPAFAGAPSVCSLPAWEQNSERLPPPHKSRISRSSHCEGRGRGSHHNSKPRKIHCGRFPSCKCFLRVVFYLPVPRKCLPWVTVLSSFMQSEAAPPSLHAPTCRKARTDHSEAKSPRG